MYSKPSIPAFLTLAFVLTITGVASARRPSSLAEVQERSARVLATCPSAPATSGYRDMLTRFAPSAAPSATPVVLASHRLRGHLALKCDGGDVHASGGYRDMLVRFLPQSPETLTARADRYQAQ